MTLDAIFLALISTGVLAATEGTSAVAAFAAMLCGSTFLMLLGG